MRRLEHAAWLSATCDSNYKQTGQNLQRGYIAIVECATVTGENLKHAQNAVQVSNWRGQN
jgi:hypothetical protein